MKSVYFLTETKANRPKPEASVGSLALSTQKARCLVHDGVSEFTYKQIDNQPNSIGHQPRSNGLEAMASNLIVMASNLVAMACNLISEYMDDYGSIKKARPFLMQTSCLLSIRGSQIHWHIEEG